jgi:hypothetical protein
VDTAGGLGFRNALHAVDASFVAEAAVRADALHQGDDLLEPADLGLREVDDVDTPALALGVARVHAEELGGEERRFAAACAGADLEDRAALGVGVLRPQLVLELRLQLADARFERVALGDRYRVELVAARQVPEQLARLVALAHRLLIALVELDHRLELRERLRGVAIDRGVAERGGVGQLVGQLAVRARELVELLDHGAV